MLLKHLYDFAVSRRLLDDDAFETRAIRFVIELTSTGELIGVQDISPDGKRGFDFPAVPKTARVKKGKVAEFLADGIDSIFGLSPDPEKPKDADMLAAKCDDFWSQIDAAATETKFPALAVLQKFRPKSGTPPSFLKLADGKWAVITATGSEVRLAGASLTFRVSGELLHAEQTVVAPYWRAVFARTIAEEEEASDLGRCLITGDCDVPIARTHTPRIGNIPNVGIDGTIVSFEKSAPAFSSYGKVQSNNAPCSVSATRAYSKALQFLVDRKDHSVAVGKTKLCFWAAETPIAKTPFAFLNKPDPKIVRDFVRAPFAGIERGLAHRDRFFAVTLAGNSGRIVVRHWLQVTVEKAVENLQHWFTDLELDVLERPAKKAKPAGKEKDFHPLSIYWLSCATVREAKDLPADVPAQLYRAALEGTAPSLALLKPLLDQLHSRLLRDENYNLIYDESRFALLKLILNRNQTDPAMELKSSLTTDTDDPAYNCGRLLAVLAATQAKAHDFKLEGPGVAERYFGTASVSPASVFPLLLRLNRHHLSKIGKSERFGGHERFIQQQIEAVLVLFKPAQPGRPPTFPRTLDLQSQGRFALGFYQQTAADAAARQANKKESAPVPATAS